MNRIKRAYLAGKAAAESAFKAVPPPQPKPAPAPAMQQQKVPPPTKPTDPPVATPRPSIAPLPPPAPAAMVGAQAATQLMNPIAKFSEFNFHCTPPARPSPDDLRPDNGKTYQLKDNAATPMDLHNAINGAFSSIDVQPSGGNNPDIQDSGLAGPPSPWDM